MRTGAVVGVGLALIAAVVLVLMLQSDPRRSGSNYVPEFNPVAIVKANGQHCQDAGLVPADTGGLNLLVGTYGRPTPRIDVLLRDERGRRITFGTLPAGQEQGHVIVPLRRVKRTTAGVTACIRTGPGGRTVLYGEAPNVRLAWVRPESETFLAILPTIARRFALGKANPVGPWLLAFAALLAALAAFFAIRLLRRELAA